MSDEDEMARWKRDVASALSEPRVVKPPKTSLPGWWRAIAQIEDAAARRVRDEWKH